jgi:AGZA family xanthine/uracil permease-like MFS transporter
MEAPRRGKSIREAGGGRGSPGREQFPARPEGDSRLSTSVMSSDAQALRESARGWFVRSDIDGFFGLFVDNLVQLLVVVGLCPVLAGLPEALVVGRILPGLAVSLIGGNLFYAWQAHRLSLRTGKPVTALPFGINTVSLFAFIFLILAPVYRETHNADLAWKVSLVAGFFGGLIEIVTSFFGAWVRRHTPRAALLSTLAGSAITFISMGFIFQIFSAPLIALFPALLVLIGYAGRVRWPFGVPTGLLAVLVGLIGAWILRGLGIAPMPAWPAAHLGVYPPRPMVEGMFALLGDPLVWRFAPVFISMAVLNVIASIQNLESAEAAGDKFDTRSSLLVNGGSAVLGVFFGNPFAPTIYIGHPGWKALGARVGYSVMNGVAVTLICVTGAVPFLLWFMPQEVTFGILLWIGLVITAQAFQEVPKMHAPAVAIGFIPSLAAWGELLVETALRKAGPTGYALRDIASTFSPDLFLYGMLSLAQGFMLISIFLSAILAKVIDREWRAAACWCLIAAAASACGIIHSFVWNGPGIVAAPFQWTGFGGAIPSGMDFAVIYLGAAVLLFALHQWKPGVVEH